MISENIEIAKLSEELLKELEANTIEGSEVIDSLSICEKSLKNIQLEEAELNASSRNKGAQQVFKIDDSKKAKLPAHERTRFRKNTLKRIIALSEHSSILLDEINKEHAKMIIPFMVEPYKNSIEKTKKVITKCATRLLSALIPYPLKAIRTQYGTRPFISHPGFVWECSPEYNSHRYWIVPDTLYYFPQFSEMDVLRENYPKEKLFVVDNAIDRLLQAQINIRKRQTQIAIKVSYLENYEDLINFNVDCALYIFRLMGLNIKDEDIEPK